MTGLDSALPFSLSTDGDVVSGLERRRDAIPRRRLAFGLCFTEPSGVLLILKAFLKSLQTIERNISLVFHSTKQRFTREKKNYFQDTIISLFTEYYNLIAIGRLVRR